MKAGVMFATDIWHWFRTVVYIIEIGGLSRRRLG